jgi:hypothetical protein
VVGIFGVRHIDRCETTVVTRPQSGRLRLGHFCAFQGKLTLAAVLFLSYCEKTVGIDEMLSRCPPITLAVLPLFFGFAVSARTAEVPQPPSPIQVAPDDDADCIAIGYIYEKILVGRGRNRIEIDIGGGACGPKFSDLSATSADGGNSDIVDLGSCPAYGHQIAKLTSVRPAHRSHLVSRGHAGPFFINDSQKLFDLESAEGRMAAAQWISQTLVAVRPCWNNFRDDQTRYVVDNLYPMISSTR